MDLVYKGFNIEEMREFIVGMAKMPLYTSQIAEASYLGLMKRYNSLIEEAEKFVEKAERK